MARTTSASSRPKEIAFVEDQLRLPDIWNALEKSTEEIEGLLQRKSIALMAVAAQDEKVRDHETDALATLAGDELYTTQSVARQERMVKECRSADKTLREMERTLRHMKFELDQLDVDLRSAEKWQAAHLARLNSASSYMDFLSSARNARSVMEASVCY